MSESNYQASAAVKSSAGEYALLTVTRVNLKIIARLY